GEVAFPAGVDMGHTPVGAVGFVGVLVVDRIAVGGGEDLTARPVAAQALAFDGPGVVGGEDQPVVLVGLVDDAGLVVADEVADEVEVAGGQIGEPVGGHLVGDGVDVAEVFDGQVALPFGLGEERDGREFGDEDRGGE